MVIAFPKETLVLKIKRLRFKIRHDRNKLQIITITIYSNTFALAYYEIPHLTFYF